MRKALKQFAKRIDERASQSRREMPALLAELSNQGKTLTVLGSAPVQRPGLCCSVSVGGGGRDEAVAQAPASQYKAPGARGDHAG